MCESSYCMLHVYGCCNHKNNLIFNFSVSSVMHDNEKELLASDISCEACSIMYCNYLDLVGPFMVTSMNGPAYKNVDSTATVHGTESQTPVDDRYR